MPKLAKQYYYGKTGEKKINCYVLHIPKKMFYQIGGSVANENIKMYVKDNKIIIEKQ